MVIIPIGDKDAVIIQKIDDWCLCRVPNPLGVDWGGWKPNDEHKVPQCWFPEHKLRPFT